MCFMAESSPVRSTVAELLGKKDFSYVLIPTMRVSSRAVVKLRPCFFQH